MNWKWTVKHVQISTAPSNRDLLSLATVSNPHLETNVHGCIAKALLVLIFDGERGRIRHWSPLSNNLR